MRRLNGADIPTSAVIRNEPLLGRHEKQLAILWEEMSRVMSGDFRHTKFGTDDFTLEAADYMARGFINQFNIPP